MDESIGSEKDEAAIRTSHVQKARIRALRLVGVAEYAELECG